MICVRSFERKANTMKIDFVEDGELRSRTVAQMKDQWIPVCAFFDIAIQAKVLVPSESGSSDEVRPIVFSKVVTLKGTKATAETAT